MGDGVVLLAVVLGAVNVAAFAAFGWDKRQSQRYGWRLSEGYLLSLAAGGGFFGAKLGQVFFRHKTRKQPFARRLNLIGWVWVVFLAVCGVLVYIVGS